MLIVGDSYAFWLRARCATALPGTVVYGVRGGCVGSDTFRREAIRRAAQHRAREAVIIAGGNDLARPDFNLRCWIAQLEELTLGLLAAGVAQIWVLPIPPRAVLRMADVSARRFRRRRWAVNRTLSRLFRRPPVVVLAFTFPADFLGSDGVHPSVTGWRALAGVVRAATSSPTALPGPSSH